MRRRASHIIMQRKDSGKTITVPVPNHDELRIGTLQSIIRQSNILGANLRLNEVIKCINATIKLP